MEKADETYEVALLLVVTIFACTLCLMFVSDPNSRLKSCKNDEKSGAGICIAEKPHAKTPNYIEKQ